MRAVSVGMTSAIALGAFWAQHAQAQAGVQTDAASLDEIIVTATRQAQSLQRVPIAVTAVTGESLVQSGVVGLQNLGSLAPGVQVQQQFKPGDAVYQIRGQLQSDSAPTIDPSVGVYFDDVYIARSPGTLTSLLDIARIEVLKGPQGTLFGKNTTGGAIRIVSNVPTSEFEGYGSVSYESFDRYKLEGVVNVPLGETFAIRMAGQYTKKTGGYGTNLISGRPIDTDETTTFRGSMLWEPTDRLRVQVTGDYSKIDAGGLPTYLAHYEFLNGQSSARAVAIQSGLGAANTPANLAAGTAILNSFVSRNGRRDSFLDTRVPTAQSYTLNAATGQFTFNGGEIDPVARVRTWGVLANISYDLDFATLKSITSYRDVNAYYTYDLDGTPFALIESEQANAGDQFSQELLLNGKAFDNRFDWTLGALYFTEEPYARNQSVALGALSALGGGAGTNTISQAKNTAWGFFGQGTFQFTDQLSVTGGIRYTIDERLANASSFNRGTSGSQSCLFTVANGLATNVAFVPPCNLITRATFKEISYTGSLNYQIDPSKLVYLKTSRGFRAGGFNSRVNAPEVLASFLPETVTDYEFGVKAEWLDRTLRTNLAVFYSKGTDVQQGVNGVSPTNGALITLTQNIGTRTVKGFEFDMMARPASWFSVDAGLAYIHGVNDNPVQPDVRWVNLTPPWSWNVGTTIETPWSEMIGGRLRVDMSFRDKMHDGAPLRNPANGAILYVGYYRDVTLINARYTLRHQPTGIELAVYGRNLTNELYEARRSVIAGIGIDLANVAEPRVIGVQLKVPFGAAAGR